MKLRCNTIEISLINLWNDFLLKRCSLLKQLISPSFRLTRHLSAKKLLMHPITRALKNLTNNCLTVIFWQSPRVCSYHVQKVEWFSVRRFAFPREMRMVYFIQIFCTYSISVAIFDFTVMHTAFFPFFQWIFHLHLHFIDMAFFSLKEFWEFCRAVLYYSLILPIVHLSRGKWLAQWIKWYRVLRQVWW